ncbi:MAG TPA: secretin and TonB N-terminal domain-containing protein [Armatimonadota bacterium]|nr:secretin and TonB N-terminal domain-containing protein [Armatimonadota bacterium]
MVALIRALAARQCRGLWLIGLLALAIAAAAGPGYRITSLDFVGSPIPVVLKALADVSGTNIAVAPDVKGDITLKLRNVTLEEALTIIANMANLSYRLTGNTYLVTPRVAESATRPTEVGAEPPATAVVPLTAISAADAIGALNIAFKDVAVKEIPGRLVLSGPAKRLLAAKALLAEIDLPGKPADDVAPAAEPDMAETSYHVKAVVAWQAKQYLEELYKGDGLTIRYAPQRLWVESAADAPADAAAWKSNELILRGPKPVVARALASVARIDVEMPQVEHRCNVKRIYATQAISYLLERFQARGLTILTAPMTFSEVASMAEGEKAAATVKNNPVGAMVRRDKDGTLNITEPIGDFILRGPEDVVQQAMAALTAVDIGPARVEKIYTLRFLKGDDAKKKLDEIYSQEGLQVTLAPAKRGTAGKAAGEGGGPPTAGRGTGAEVFDLVLRGPDPVVTRAQSLLLTLDTAPAQVSINTEIVSLNSGEVKNLGVNWSGIIGTTTVAGQASVDFTEAQPSDPLDLGRIVRAPLNINATINALQTANKAKIINRPSTVVQNGEQATIHVGGQFFYETVSAIANTGPVFSLNSVNTGVTLQVRPLVSSDGLITLEITSSVTETPTFRKGVSGADLPTIQENSSTTVVQVRSGETLVIGGLMQSREEEQRQSVPGLGKLPLIGSMFRSKRVAPSQTELVILVTPSLVGTGAPAPAPTPSAGQ